MVFVSLCLCGGLLVDMLKNKMPVWEEKKKQQQKKQRWRRDDLRKLAQRSRIGVMHGRRGRVENEVERPPACTCGSLTTVTHTNRNIPNKLQAFRVWQADIFYVRGTISYLRCKVEGAAGPNCITQRCQRISIKINT